MLTEGDLEFCLSWIREHFRENGPPLHTLSMLPAKTAVILLKFSYNPRMDYLSKTAPERILNSSVFARNHNSRELSKIDALTQLGRISKAARLADQLECASDTESNAGNVVVGEEVSILG